MSALFFIMRKTLKNAQENDKKTRKNGLKFPNCKGLAKIKC